MPPSPLALTLEHSGRPPDIQGAHDPRRGAGTFGLGVTGTHTLPHISRPCPFQGLERINFNSNNIESIPVGINCPKLESFLISQNSLTELPPDMPLWPSLKILFANANSLNRLPETFLQNTWIQRINLARNSKCSTSSKHILTHIKQVTEKNKGMYWAPDTL